MRPGIDRLHGLPPRSRTLTLDAGIRQTRRVHPRSRLVPELDVSNLDASLSFYSSLLGFSVLYERPEERFVCLILEEALLMIEEAAGPGRRFRTAPLTHPFGRGINLQIQISDVDTMLERITVAGQSPLIPIEERWYTTDRGPVGNRQFVVEDPDGYLLQFVQDIATRDGRTGLAG